MRGGTISYRGVALVVEDEAAVRDAACAAAAQCRFLPVAAGDSDEAIAMLQSIRVDLLIVQLRARGQIDGAELAQFLRLGNPAVRVVYLARHPRLGDLEAALGDRVVDEASPTATLIEELSPERSPRRARSS
jgi:CheY-like chemotaxis protein